MRAALLAAFAAAVAGCARWSPIPPEPPAETQAEAMALYARAMSLELTGRPGDAADLYLAAHALDRDRPAILNRLTDLLIALQRSDEAAAILEAAARRAPDSPDLWWRLGRLHLLAEQWDPAEKAIRRALELRPGDIRLAVGLATALEAAGQDAESLRLLDRAREFGAPAVVLLPPMGRIYLRERARGLDARGAGERIEALAGPTSGDVDALLIAAEIFSKGNEPGRALALLDRALSLAPDDPNQRLQIATGLLRSGDPSRAIPLLHDLSRIDDPASLAVLQLLAAVHLDSAERADDGEAARLAREAALDPIFRLVEAEPGEIRHRLALAALQLRLGRVEETVETMESADPDDPAVSRALARRTTDADPDDNIRTRLERMTREEPDRAWPSFVLGEADLAAGRAGAAAEHFSRAAGASNPFPAIFFSWASSALRRDGNATEADAILGRGVTRHPGNPALLEARAGLALLRGDRETAADWAGSAVRAAEDAEGRAPGALRARQAVWLAFAQREDEAFDALSAALEEDLFLIQNYVAFAASAAESLDCRDPPRAPLRRAIGRRPDSPIMLMCAGLYESQVGEPGRALAHFEAAQEAALRGGRSEDWLKAPFFFWYGAASERAGRVEQAESLLARCIELDPAHDLALNYLAYLWADRGVRLDEAEDYVRRALAVDPESGAYIDTLGWIQFRRGRFEEALATLRRALERDPDEAEILDHAGDALERLGRESEAIGYWKRAFVQDPEIEGLREKLEARGVDPGPLREAAEAAGRRRERIRRERFFDPDSPPSGD